MPDEVRRPPRDLPGLENLPGAISGDQRIGRSESPVSLFIRKGCMANAYKDWSSHDLEQTLMLDRREGFLDEELTEEFDHRCTQAFDEVLEETCTKYPNVIYP